MAGHVKALLAMLAWAGLAHAQTLPDPTRPAGAIETVVAVAGGEGAAIQAGLQSIIRRQGGKPAAIINGQYVELGGMAGDAKLVRINDDSVVLQGTMGKETLFLTPGVEKKMQVEQARTSRNARGRTKDGAGK